MSRWDRWDPPYSLRSLGHMATSIQGKPITVECVTKCFISQLLPFFFKTKKILLLLLLSRIITCPRWNVFPSLQIAVSYLAIKILSHDDLWLSRSRCQIAFPYLSLLWSKLQIQLVAGFNSQHVLHKTSAKEMTLEVNFPISLPFYLAILFGFFIIKKCLLAFK